MDFKKIYETACAGDGGSSSVESAAPEHTIEVVNGQDKKTLTEASGPGYKNMSTQGYESDLSDESRMIDEMNAEDDDAYNEFGPYGPDGVEDSSEEEQEFWNSQDVSERAGDDWDDDGVPSDEEIERQMAAWAEEDEERDRENNSPGAQMKDYVDTVSKEEEEQWDRDHPFDDPEDDDLSGTEDDYNKFGPYGSDGVEEPSEDEQAFWDSQDNSEDEDPLDRLDDGDFYDLGDKQTYHENINKRLELRKKLNESLFEAIDSNRLKEELEDEDSSYNLTRYSLQRFNNGGTPMGDGQIDGEVDGPSSYEAWRRGINDKKRKARYEQENADRNSKFASPKITQQPEHVLDGQNDSFLYEWLKSKKQSMNLNESKSISSRIDNWLKESSYEDDEEDFYELTIEACDGIRDVIKHEFDFHIENFDDKIIDVISEYQKPTSSSVIDSIVEVVCKEEDKDEDEFRDELNMIYGLGKYFRNVVDQLVYAIQG